MNCYVAAAIALLGPAVLGCGEEEAEGRDAAYPIGYTVPAHEVRRAADTPSPPRANGPAAEPLAGVALEQGAGEGEEVVVGAESDATRAEYPDNDPSALTDFHGALDPYGNWVEDASYGTVWVPSPTVVGPDFTPYVSAGRWAYDDDYVWVSDYEWGWAPFHYGRWVYGGGVGWEWIPGRTYSGAWVSWRWGLNDWPYVGWAPLPPTWCWHRGAAVGIGFVPVAPYAFVPTGELFTPGLHGRVLAGPQVGVIAAHTRPWVPATPMVAPGGPGARIAARAQVGGPPPSLLRINESAVVHGGLADRGVLQARAFARPGGTVAMAQSASFGPALAAPTGARSVGPAGFAYAPRGGGPPAVGPSHFGGRLGTGFVGSAPERPAYSGGSPRPTPSVPAFRGTYAAPTPSAPAFRGGYTAPAGPPAFRGGTSYSPPSTAFRSGSVAPAPAFHSGSVAPTVHVSPGGFSGGGFHGGGGGGGRGGGHR